jgi:hypothetical protein
VLLGADSHADADFASPESDNMANGSKDADQREQESE